MLLYHPDRYRITRHFHKQIKNLPGEGLPTEETFDAAKRIITSSYSEQISNWPINERLERPTKFLGEEISIGMIYSLFSFYGRNIFHFPYEITEEFGNTDIDEVPISALSFPFGCFYMSFGKQNHLDLWGNGYYVDGVYISNYIKESLQIHLSTVRDDTNYDNPKEWITNPDRYYFLGLDISEPEAIIANVVEKALKEEIKSRRQTPELPPELNELKEKGIIKDISQETSVQAIRDIRKGFDVFNEALKLVINGLCYIASYKNNIEEDWPDEAPQALVEKVKNPSRPKEFKQAKSMLAQKGFTKVHFCEKKKSKGSSPVKQENSSSDREFAKHWRRGHWRNQAIGQRWTERKLVWIRPSLINSDKESSDITRIYEIEKKDNIKQ